MIRVATAGWTIPRGVQDRFPCDGRHLERYARVLHAVEINSSFYRPHRRSTYERWASETPETFRFSVKLPKTITHAARFHRVDDLLDRFLDEVGGLGAKLGVVLVQLPPTFAFAVDEVDPFFATLRARHPGAVTLEPRHASWFSATAEAMLLNHHVGRVAADPASSASAARPGGWSGDAIHAGCLYYRWHGSPRMYWSPYADEWLSRRAAEVIDTTRERGASEAWCVLDNTAAGAALDDALRLKTMIGDA